MWIVKMNMPLILMSLVGAYTMAFNSEFILQPPRVYVVNEDR